MKENSNKMSNTYDITNLTDAALDVFLDVKSGAESVVVEHLTPAERLAVCQALGIKAPLYWLSDTAPSTARTAGPDYEGRILAEQDARFQE